MMLPRFYCSAAGFSTMPVTFFVASLPILCSRLCKRCCVPVRLVGTMGASLRLRHTRLYRQIECVMLCGLGIGPK